MIGMLRIEPNLFPSTKSKEVGSRPASSESASQILSFSDTTAFRSRFCIARP